MSYSYGLRRRRRRLPYRSRVSAYRRKRAFYARRLRRRRRYKSKSKRRYLKYNPASRLGKRLTNRRTNIGLPPLKLRHYEEVTGFQNYTQASQAIWSLAHNIDELQLTNLDQNLDQRTTNNVTILPGYLKLTLKQPNDITGIYRIMVIKQFGNKPNYTNFQLLVPHYTLQSKDTFDLETAFYASYTRTDERGTDKSRLDAFKVLYDKLIVWDTRDRPKIKQLLIKLPARNVEYDPKSSGGTNHRNGIRLCILTNVPNDDNTYQINCQYTLNYT